MQEYTFKFGTFYFKIHANEDKEAVFKARRALEESMPENAFHHLKVDLTAGAFDGKLYIEPEELTVCNICKTVSLPEVDVSLPF